MADETWLTADEAVETGYADKTEKRRIRQPTAFDYRLYQNAPEKMVALARARAWNMSADSLAGIAADNGQEKDDDPMTTKSTTAEQQAAQDAAIAEAVAAATKDAVARAEAAEAAVDDMKQKQSVDAGNQAKADAAEIAAMCSAAGVAAMAAPLIREGVSTDEAQLRIDGAKEITAAVDLARKQCPSIPEGLADEYIGAGKTIEAVRADLFEKMAAAGDGGSDKSVNAHHKPAEPAEKVATIDTVGIYNRINHPGRAA
jgi:hypothetical protein